MAKCKECIHYESCSDFSKIINSAVDVEKGCEHFKNRTDFVEVVRCEKCKHALWDEENEMWKCVESAYYDEDAAEWFGFHEYHNCDFFCADGERRNNE